MPEVVFFWEKDGSVPLPEWMDSLPRSTRTKCRERLALQVQAGRQLRRPVADYLRDGIHELRIRRPEGNHRILYFFHGRDVAVVSHGFTKPGASVPRREIDRAIQRRWRFQSDPLSYRQAMED